MATPIPPSLNLPPHLSAHKYFYVCTLTIVAWDTLVLSPRSWYLLRSKGWPPLKWLYTFLRVFMPVEFAVAGVAFFDNKWSQSQCRRWYLFEPISTAILLASVSAIHIIRIHAIYNKSKIVLAVLGIVFAAQIIVTGVASAFFQSVPLDEGQGCVAGPKANWVGIYWVPPTLLYILTFVLAVTGSIRTLAAKPLNPWRLMLRDGLHFYGIIVLVNVINVLFWFIVKADGPKDAIKTTVSPMCAVLSTTMTLRILLSLRGDLAEGGALPGATTAESRSGEISSGVGRSTGQVITNPAPTYTLDNMRVSNGVNKPSDWYADSATDDTSNNAPEGIKIRVDKEIGYDRGVFNAQ